MSVCDLLQETPRRSTYPVKKMLTRPVCCPFLGEVPLHLISPLIMSVLPVDGKGVTEFGVLLRATLSLWTITPRPLRCIHKSHTAVPLHILPRSHYSPALHFQTQDSTYNASIHHSFIIKAHYSWIQAQQGKRISFSMSF